MELLPSPPDQVSKIQGSPKYLQPQNWSPLDLHWLMLRGERWQSLMLVTWTQKGLLTSDASKKNYSTEVKERQTPTLGLSDSACWLGRMTQQHPHQHWAVLLARWTDLWRWRKGSLSSRQFFWDSPRESPHKSIAGSGRVSHNAGLEKQTARVELPMGRLCAAWPMECESNLSVCAAAKAHIALCDA